MINERFIILLNFSLLTLILYNLFEKTNKLTEPLAACDKNKNDLVYKQEAKIDKLFGDLNNIKNGITILKTGVKKNKSGIDSNTIRLKQTSNKVKNKSNREMKKLDKL
jgi:hypothetical protein